MITQIQEMAETRREQAAKLNFFDASVWLGPPDGFPMAAEMTAEHLLETLRHYFTASALFSHWYGPTLGPQDGNRALEAVLPSLPKDCGAIWTGLPLLPGEAGPLPGLGKTPARLRGVRLFPKTHRFPLADWMVGSLCEWMIDRRLPLFVWHTEIEWGSLRSLAKSFPKLPLVVESQPQKILYHLRPLSAILRDCPNVLVETSNFIGQGFIEYAVREFGAERLIFGSFLPVNDPLAPIGMLIDADIGKTEQALIAGGNLRRLVREVKS